MVETRGFCFCILFVIRVIAGPTFRCRKSANQSKPRLVCSDGTNGDVFLKILGNQYAQPSRLRLPVLGITNIRSGNRVNSASSAGFDCMLFVKEDSDSPVFLVFETSILSTTTVVNQCFMSRIIIRSCGRASDGAPGAGTFLPDDGTCFSTQWVGVRYGAPSSAGILVCTPTDGIKAPQRTTRQKGASVEATGNNVFSSLPQISSCGTPHSTNDTHMTPMVSCGECDAVVRSRPPTGLSRNPQKYDASPDLPLSLQQHFPSPAP